MDRADTQQAEQPLGRSSPVYFEQPTKGAAIEESNL